MGLALLLVSALAGAAPDVAETWAKLQAELPADPARRATVLLRFAANDQAALGDRLRAARAARAHAPRRAASHLAEARLCGVSGQLGARARALGRAAAALGKDGERARQEHVQRVRAADADLSRLRQLVDVREKSAVPPPLTPADEGLRRQVSDALPAWQALDDERQLAAARVLLARLRASTGDAAAAEQELAVIAEHSAGRDRAAVRVEAQRARAVLLEQRNDLEAAALASLGADRDAAVDVKKPASRQLATPYQKSKASLELCRRARAQGVECGRAEQRRFGSTLHYDFSKEPRGTFDPAVNNEVLADYDTLLRECVRTAVKERVPLTQTLIELEWAVGQDGRVPGYDLRPTRLRGTSYDRCLRAAFDVFRYPPYAGEMQHVRLSFEVGGEL